MKKGGDRAAGSKAKKATAAAAPDGKTCPVWYADWSKRSLQDRQKQLQERFRSFNDDASANGSPVEVYYLAKASLVLGIDVLSSSSCPMRHSSKVNT